jgi:uncharacterized protein YggE
MRKLVFLTTLLFASAAYSADMVAVRSITVNGMAKREVVPDEAHVTVNLNAMEPKLSAAKASHDAKLRKLMEIVRDAGIDEKKVKTQSSNIQPVYSYRQVDAKSVKDNCVSAADGTPCPPVASGMKSIRVLDGYRAQSNIDITVTDTTKVAGLMETIADADFEKGAMQDWGNLLSMYYTLGNPDKIRNEMLGEALKNAHDKAAMMAQAAGSDIMRVYQIQESGTPNFNFPRPMMAFAAAPVMNKAPGGGGMAPPAGEQEVNANVTVTYELKD